MKPVFSWKVKTGLMGKKSESLQSRVRLSEMMQLCWGIQQADGLGMKSLPGTTLVDCSCSAVMFFFLLVFFPPLASLSLGSVVVVVHHLN